MHPWAVAPLAKGSSFLQRDGGGAACLGSGQGQRLQEQERGQASLPGRAGMEDRDKAGSADLKAVAASSSAPCNFPSHGTWLAELGRLSEDTRSSPQSLL